MLSSIIENKKVALVHDWLTTLGGAERVVALWKESFPKAPVYTLIYDKKSLSHMFPQDTVVTSKLQKWPGVTKYYRLLLSLMPSAFEEFDFSDYDMVLSSSSSCAKGILTSASTFHASYIHTPMRYAWELYPEYLRDSGSLTRWAMRRLMPGIRLWDLASANRVDMFLCGSHEVARRIRKTYRRDAVVVHPPIETGFFTPLEPSEEPKKGADLGEAYLTVGRLIPYKRVDLAVKACTKAGKHLDVVGDGSEMRRLKAMAGPTVRFLGFGSDEAVRDAYRNCKALLFPGFEDFGMIPLEAQACGRPVLAYGKGGALETLKDGETGLFHPQQDADSLIEAMEDFESRTWNPVGIREHALQFDRTRHTERLLETLERGYREFQDR